MKHVVITGSTRGIGFGLAEHFLKEGCKVTINGTTSEGVERAINQLKEKYSPEAIQGFHGSVVDEKNLQNLWDQSVKEFGDVDIWINNAGIPQEREYAWEVSTKNVNDIVQVNIIGVINGSNIAMKNMMKQGHGQIFNMEGFGSDDMMMEKMTLYGTTKRALRYFTRSLAKEAKNTPVLVGTLSPGMVATDFIMKPYENKKEDLEQSKKILNILVNDVDTVTSFLVKRILANKKHGAHINFLTKGRLFWQFASSPFVKKDLIK